MPKSPIERFFEKVEITESCWNWKANRNSDGYGSFFFEGSLLKAHRFAYELLVGPIPAGLEIDHVCRNRLCCNPDHLDPVTRAENLRRGGSRHHMAARTHCPWGHEYTPENTTVYRNGRFCRACANKKNWRGRLKADALWVAENIWNNEARRVPPTEAHATRS